MGLRVNPSQRQRRLGAELRRLRIESGLTATSAGSFVAVGPAHMNHIESGRTAIAVPKLRALVELYGCKDDSVVEALAGMSQSNGRGWWSEFKHPPHNDAARDLAELESMSVRHRNFQWVQMPGLLQTAEFMRALFATGRPEQTAEMLESFVAFRLRRQRILTDPKPPEFHAVIHEAAFRMEFVGREVMRRQVEHLVEMAELPHVRIQVLPFRAESYPPGFNSAFVCHDAIVPELSTVYVEHPAASPFVIDQDNLAEFSDAFDKLSAVALPPIDANAPSRTVVRRDSLGWLQRLLYDL
ncbi:helix-turn-helix domain-containing protein [Streptomyces mayteni]